MMEQRRFHAAALLVLGIALYANQLWVGGLPGNDDATYASGALDMIESGDYLTPRFNGDPQFSTAPPMFYWLLAVFFKALGPTDLAARLTAAASTIAGMFVVFLAGLRLFGSLPAAALSAAAFALDPFIAKSGHHAVAHTAWAAATAAALLALHEARRRPLYYAAFALLCASSILFKSALGLYPLIIAGVWLLWDRAPLRHWAFFGAAALGAVGLGGAWFVLEYRRYGEHFLREHFGTMLLGYAFKFGVVYHTQSPGPHLLAVLRRMADNTILTLPLTLPLLWRARSSQTRLVFAWAAVPTLLLAATARFEPRYMAPAFPGIALAIGWSLDRLLSAGRKRKILAAVYGTGLAWALATLIYPIPRGRDMLAEAAPLIAAVRSEVPEGRRWLLVVAPQATIDPAWPNRMLVDHYEMDGPVNRGLVQQLLFYTRRRFFPIHAPDVAKQRGQVILAQDKYLPLGSVPGLRPLLRGPDWTLYRSK